MLLLDRSFDVSVAPVASADLPEQALRGVERFLFHEARLLDERRFAEWLELWTEDGRYWAPRFHGQADPFEQISLFWEDAVLREVRMRRLENPRNWSQQPPTRSSRAVSNVSVEGLDAAGHLIVRSAFQYTDWRGEQRQLAGTLHHKLAATEAGGWKMVLKKVEFVNCEDIFGTLEVFV